MIMSTPPNTPSVSEAKGLLRQARLREHVQKIGKAITSGDMDALAKASSGFVALYRSANKTKKVSKK